MFIRRTQTRKRIAGQPYTTHRLVHSARVGGAVKQTTLLNLGSHFDLPQGQWPALAARIDELVRGQHGLLDPTLSEAGQALAQRYAAQLIALHPRAASITHAQATRAAKAAPGEPERYHEVDLDSFELVRARSVGVEYAALSVMRQCGFEDKLAELGLNRAQIAAAVGNIIARMAHPGSELATHAWLQQRSGLGELIDFDFEAMDLNRLYRVSDVLYKHREALQEHLFAQAQSIFGLGETITLYDPTRAGRRAISTTIGALAACRRSRWKKSASSSTISEGRVQSRFILLHGARFPTRRFRHSSPTPAQAAAACLSCFPGPPRCAREGKSANSSFMLPMSCQRCSNSPASNRRSR